jgi:site-specific DNA-methyltransferase (adenine-specific)
MSRRKALLTPTERQKRWRAKKRKAEIAAGLRPARKRKPLTATQRQRRWRAKKYAATEMAKYMASRERRRLSRAAPQIEPEFRLGDCREILRDIEAASVALVLTDPPWGNANEPLYRWLADFAARVLIPGGSLICCTGSTTWCRDAAIFAEHLQSRPVLFTPLTHEQRLLGEFVRIGARPILWFSKGRRRNKHFVPTLARSSGKDKALHPWQQGDAVWQWIEPLTGPGDLVLNPFCGSGEWGHICGAMGRRWIGCDIVEGGSTRIVV